MTYDFTVTHASKILKDSTLKVTFPTGVVMVSGGANVTSITISSLFSSGDKAAGATTFSLTNMINPRAVKGFAPFTYEFKTQGGD